MLGGSVDGWRLSHKRCGVSFPVSRGGLSAPRGMIGEDGGGVGHGAEGFGRAGVWREGAHRAEPGLGRSDVVVFFIGGGVRLGSAGPCVTGRLRSVRGPVLPLLSRDRAEWIWTHLLLPHDAM